MLKVPSAFQWSKVTIPLHEFYGAPSFESFRGLQMTCLLVLLMEDKLVGWHQKATCLLRRLHSLGVEMKTMTLTTEKILVYTIDKCAQRGWLVPRVF